MASGSDSHLEVNRFGALLLWVMTRKASKRKFTVTSALAGPHDVQFGCAALVKVWNGAPCHTDTSAESHRACPAWKPVATAGILLVMRPWVSCSASLRPEKLIGTTG